MRLAVHLQQLDLKPRVIRGLLMRAKGARLPLHLLTRAEQPGHGGAVGQRVRLCTPVWQDCTEIVTRSAEPNIVLAPELFWVQQQEQVAEDNDGISDLMHGLPPSREDTEHHCSTWAICFYMISK